MSNESAQETGQAQVTCGCGGWTFYPRPDIGKWLATGSDAVDSAFCWRCNTACTTDEDGKPVVTPMVPDEQRAAAHDLAQKLVNVVFKHMPRLVAMMDFVMVAGIAPEAEAYLQQRAAGIDSPDVPQLVPRVDSEAVMATRLYRELASQSTLSEEDTIILAALQQGGLAAAEWLAAEIARLSGRFVNSEAASMTLEDELALRATAAPTLTPGYWLADALSATGQEAPTDGEILDALGGGGRE